MQVEKNLEASILQPIRRAATAVAIAVLLIIVWANTAQLATTIHVSGTLGSSQPQYELQHPYGGKLKNVFVEQHDTLEDNQTVFELDVSLQEETSKQIETQINQLSQENEILKLMLNKSFKRDDLQHITNSSTLSYYLEKLDQYDLNINNSKHAVQSLMAQATLKDTSLEHLKERNEVNQTRLSAVKALVTKGMATAAQEENQIDRVMGLTSEIIDATADQTALRDQLRQTQLKSQQFHTDFQLELRRKLVSNDQRLPDLKRQLLALRDEISNAIIRSPISGSVMELNYATSQMQVPKGATLAIVSRSLIDPQVHIIIPTSSIDQVTTGMKGALTLSSLPQRNLSRISAEVTAISPDVFSDPSGDTIGYKAIAKINHDELVEALSSLNVNLHLSSGMPVALALEGRKTTFSQYLVAPFFSIFNGALQD